jgi:hypothetical protein
MKKFVERLILVFAAAGAAEISFGQETAPQPPSFPVVRVGGTIFADYTYQQNPTGTDTDGHTIRQNSFNVTRAYINLTGDLSRVISLRVTPDLVRDTDQNSSLSGSSVYRLKFAYVQFALDDVLGKGSWMKFGVHGTPYLDFTDPIYRYRFQGPLFLDREGYLSTADAGISARYAFPSDYGDVVVGGFNGEGYNHSEANDQKAFQIRGTLRPAPSVPIVRGLRLTAFWDLDHYQRSDPKERLVGAVTFEHPRINAGFEYLVARDQPTATGALSRARGWSVFATPRTSFGLEALLRYDDLRPDSASDARKTRAIGGLSYWFPVQKGVATAVLLDYERVHYSHFSPPKKTEERYAVHTLMSF